MKIYFFYNQNFLKVKDYFVNSMKDKFELCPINLDEQFNVGEWRLGDSGSGKIVLWLFKTDRIIDSINQNMGNDNIIVFSDTDIQFFRPVIPTIEKYIDNKDMVFQSEFIDTFHVNIGFIAIRCNQRSLDFWVNVFNCIKHTTKWDQLIVNCLLRGYAIRNDKKNVSMMVLNRHMFLSSRKISPAVIDYLIHTSRRPDFESFESDMDKIETGNLEWSLFPHKITASSHGNIPDDVELHHVNIEGGNADVKISAMQQVAGKVQENDRKI